jgi:hypothetical protein
MAFEKIGAQHLARKAVLYVQQSSAHQVLHNRESQALQYAMRGRLTQLGWSEIEVIDDDLGRSAAGGVVRAGFERMVAEVCLGKVGAVAAREVSRFARNSRDWQQLVEMCRVVDTLLIDQEAKLRTTQQRPQPGPVISQRERLAGGVDVDVERILRDVDADIGLDLCHDSSPWPRIGSGAGFVLRGRASAPLNCSGTIEGVGPCLTSASYGPAR